MTRMKRVPAWITPALPMLVMCGTLLSAERAFAYDDYCRIYAGNNHTGSSASMWLFDDVRVPSNTSNAWDDTSARLTNAEFKSYFPAVHNSGSSIEINASKSDVNLYMYLASTVTPSEISDARARIGGDGLTFNGKTALFQCSKGQFCRWNLTGWNNLGRSYICQREFQHVTKFYFNGRTIASEIKSLVEGMVEGASGVDDVTNVTTQAIWETGATVCSRFRGYQWTPQAFCSESAGALKHKDLLRAHIEMTLNPDADDTCFGPFGCYDLTDLVVGDAYRVAIDLYVYPSLDASGVPHFDMLDPRVWVEDGIADTTISNKILALIRDMNVGAYFERALFKQVGAAVARTYNLPSASWDSDAEKINLGRDSLAANGERLQFGRFNNSSPYATHIGEFAANSSGWTMIFNQNREWPDHFVDPDQYACNKSSETVCPVR